VAAPGVDADLIRIRALWYLARALIVSGAPLPWPEETTVESLVGLWLQRWMTPPSSETFEALYNAEAALQLEVSGGETKNIKRALAIHGQLSRRDVLAGQSLGHDAPPEQKARDLVPLLQAAMAEAAQHQLSLEGQIDAQKCRAEQAESYIKAAADEAVQHQHSLEEQINDQKDRADKAEKFIQTAKNEAVQHQRSLEKQINEAKSYTLNLEAQIQDQESRAEQAEEHYRAAQTVISNLERAASHAANHIKKVEDSLVKAHKDLAGLEATIRRKDSEIAILSTDLETAEITLSQTRSRLAEEKAWRREFENRPLVRLYRRLRWWLPQ